MLWLWNIYFKNCNLNFSHNRIIFRCRNYTAKHHWTSRDQVSVPFTSQTGSFERILTPPGVTTIWKEVQWEKHAFLYTLLKYISPFDYNCFFSLKRKFTGVYIIWKNNRYFSRRLRVFLNRFLIIKKWPNTRKWEVEFRNRTWHNNSTERIRIQIKWQILYTIFYSKVI